MIKTIGTEKLDFLLGKRTIAVTVKKIKIYWDNLAEVFLARYKMTDEKTMDVSPY